MRKLPCILIALVLILPGCSSTGFYVSEEEVRAQHDSLPPGGSVLYQVFLWGDGGALHSAEDPVLTLLRSKLAGADERSAVVFLGDNIYPSGMPDSLSAERKGAERRIRLQMEALKDFPGRIIIIPGNHDWQSGGAEALRRQETYVEAYLKGGNVFLPDDGLPGPVDIKLMDKDDHPELQEDIRLIVLDTEWWLRDRTEALNGGGGYDLMDAGDFLVELDIALKEHRNDHLIVAGHHPLFANGNHGGHFPLSSHLTPPILGTLYVAYRKFIGLPQDLANARYQTLKRELTQRFYNHEDLIYAAGHEHVLQYNRVEGKQRAQHYVVSGTASKQDYTTKGRGAAFTSDNRGFGIIKYYTDGSSWLEFWAPGSGDSKERGRRLFRTRMGRPYADPLAGSDGNTEPETMPDYSDSTLTTAPNPSYARIPPAARLFLGDHNRDVWAVPVQVPVLDIGRIDGGLTPTQIGGYGQSTTLRLENRDGREYVLRSVDKQAGRIWDENLQNSLARDLAQDQFSIIHPFGAFLIPPLADAIGVYHTNPRLYYVPDDPRLGVYAELMAGQLALLEERPDDDMSHVASMGRSEEVLSSRQMVLEVDADVDHRVDQRAFARARLFDMLIADWDRHPDQWRWAAFEPADEKGKIYRPVPRDRDVAFMRMNGLLPQLGKFSVFYQYQGFRPGYGNIKGLTLNALGQTRRFTNVLTRRDWIQIADSMRTSLTDSVIDAAIQSWPQAVVQADGFQTARTLKVRRDKLSRVAEGYYKLLTGTVDVAGSHKHEWFVVERLNEDETRVRVEKRTREGEFRKVVYKRTFKNDETTEIRLYGMSGNDRFEIRGSHSNGIRIRAVGGPGVDSFIDSTHVDGNTRARLYDTAAGNEWNADGSSVHFVKDPADNDYDYLTSYRYNRSDPVLFLGSNTEDGLFVGGGVRINRHEFQKQPYGQVHTLRANFAAATQAYNLRYDGFFPERLGPWDLTLNAAVLSPNNVRNYYGLGNETERTEGDARYYQARFSQYRLRTGLIRTLYTGIHFEVAPTIEITNFREDQNRFVAQPQAGISANTFNDQWYGGLEARLGLASLDNRINPRQGFSWENFVDLNLALRNTTDSYSTMGSELSVFYSPILSPQLTVASRLGVAHNIGAFPFFGANTLGSKTNLRGYRSTRFAGRTSAYYNLELRAKMFDLNSYVLGGNLGVLGFWDAGRVWTDGERSSLWHHGYGGGLWFSLYQMTVLNASVGLSEEGTYYSVGVGFFF